MTAHFTLCWYGPLLKIASKIYDVTLVKKKWLDHIRVTYDGRVNHLWVWASSDNRVMLAITFYPASKLFGQKTIAIRRTI